MHSDVLVLAQFSKPAKHPGCPASRGIPRTFGNRAGISETFRGQVDSVVDHEAGNLEEQGSRLDAVLFGRPSHPDRSSVRHVSAKPTLVSCIVQIHLLCVLISYFLDDELLKLLPVVLSLMQALVPLDPLGMLQVPHQRFLHRVVFMQASQDSLNLYKILAHLS